MPMEIVFDCAEAIFYWIQIGGVRGQEHKKAA